MSETKHISLKNLQAFLKPLMRIVNRKAESWEDLKNKPFGSTLAECILTDKLRLLADEQNITLGDFYFIEGQKYTVLFDDVTYNCTAYRDSYGTVDIGDITLMGESHPKSQDAPFFIFSDIDYGAQIFVEDNSVDHSISISTIGEVVTKLPSKYVDIPNGILTTDNYLQTTAGMQKGEGEVFNNYDGNNADGYMSHAEGSGTSADGLYSHAEGLSTRAYGDESHAEGYNTEAHGLRSHAEGQGTLASGQASHAEGEDTTASGNFQHVQGIQNIEDNQGKYAHIVGNGGMEASSDGGMKRYFSNAHTLDWGGNAWFSGDVYVGSTNGRYQDDGSKKLATEEYVTLNSVKTNLAPSDSVVDTVLAENEGYTQLYADDGELYVTVYGKTDDDLNGTDRSFQLVTEDLTIGMSWSRGTIDNVTGEDVAGTYHYKTDIIDVKPNTVYTLSKYGTEGHVALYGYDSNGSFIGASETGLVCSVITGMSEQFPLGSNTTTCVIRTKENIHGIRLVQYTGSKQYSMSWKMYEGTEEPEFVYQFEYAPTNDDLYGNGSISDTYENCVFVNGKYVSRTIRYWKKINSYNGEVIPGEYVSSTGSLDTGATVIYLLDDPEIYYGDVLRLKTSRGGGRYDFIMRYGTMYMRYSHRADDYLANGATGDSVGLNITMRNQDDKIIYPTTTYDQIILADGSKWDGGIGLQAYVDEKIAGLEFPSTDGLATKTYVNETISAMVDSAPETLNTLNELAAALGDDPNFATTISNQIGTKASSSDLTSHTGNKSNPHDVTAAQISAVPTSRTVNGKALTADITLSASDIDAAASSHNQAASTITAGTFAGAVVAQASSQTPATSLLRNSKLVPEETDPVNNGEICWIYE